MHRNPETPWPNVRRSARTPRVLTGEPTKIVTHPLLSEFGRVLADKFAWEPAYTEEAWRNRSASANFGEPQATVEHIDDDPEGDRVLERPSTMTRTSSTVTAT